MIDAVSVGMVATSTLLVASQACLYNISGCFRLHDLDVDVKPEHSQIVVFFIP